MFTLCNCVLAVFNFLFDFHRGSQLNLSIVLEETLDLDFSVLELERHW